MTNEETRLNAIGAEICKDYLGDKIRLARDGIWVIYVGDGAWMPFDPVHDLNHTDMVEMAMVEKGWKCQLKSIQLKFGYEYRYELKRRSSDDFIWELVRHIIYAPLDQKARCMMEVIGKAMEGE